MATTAEPEIPIEERLLAEFGVQDTKDISGKDVDTPQRFELIYLYLLTRKDKHIHKLFTAFVSRMQRSSIAIEHWFQKQTTRSVTMMYTDDQGKHQSLSRAELSKALTQVSHLIMSFNKMYHVSSRGKNPPESFKGRYSPYAVTQEYLTFLGASVFDSVRSLATPNGGTINLDSPYELGAFIGASIYYFIAANALGVTDEEMQKVYDMYTAARSDTPGFTEHKAKLMSSKMFRLPAANEDGGELRTLLESSPAFYIKGADGEVVQNNTNDTLLTVLTNSGRVYTDSDGVQWLPYLAVNSFTSSLGSRVTLEGFAHARNRFGEELATVARADADVALSNFISFDEFNARWKVARANSDQALARKERSRQAQKAKREAVKAAAETTVRRRRQE